MRHTDITPSSPETTFLLGKEHKIIFLMRKSFNIEIDDSKNEDTRMDNEGNYMITKGLR
jgi:hypothetical protein